MAPLLTLTPAFAAWAVMSLWPGFAIAHIDAGVLYILALAGFGAYGIILAGWAANSKYAFLGAMRSAAQIVSYEIAMGFALVGVVMASGTLNIGNANSGAITVSAGLAPLHAWRQPEPDLLLGELLSINVLPAGASNVLVRTDLIRDLGGFAVRVKMFTVPGQVIHESTRRLVLSGADGVAFIADSQVSETVNNATAFRDLKANLKANNIEFTKTATGGLDVDGFGVGVQHARAGVEDRRQVRARGQFRREIRGFHAAAGEHPQPGHERQAGGTLGQQHLQPVGHGMTGVAVGGVYRASRPQGCTSCQ